MLLSCRRFETTFSRVLGCFTLKDGTEDCLETSVRNYHFTLGEDLEDSRSHLCCGGSPKTRTRRLVLGSSRHCIQWVLGVSSPGLKRPGCDADHSLPFTLEFKNVWNCRFTPSMCLHSLHKGKFTFFVGITARNFCDCFKLVKTKVWWVLPCWLIM
jgi:hypothetical protein